LLEHAHQRIGADAVQRAPRAGRRAH
jgi:hypothetical protein